MNVSAANFSQQYSVAVASKQISQQKQEGADKVALIQSASAPPVKPGHSVSVMA